MREGGSATACGSGRTGRGARTRPHRGRDSARPAPSRRETDYVDRSSSTALDGDRYARDSRARKVELVVSERSDESLALGSEAS